MSAAEPEPKLRLADLLLGGDLLRDHIPLLPEEAGSRLRIGSHACPP
jgi:hypothetical protein